MSVTIASTGSNFGLYSNSKVKQLDSSAGPFICSFRFDPIHLSCMSSKRSLSSPASILIPNVSTAAVEDGKSEESDVVPIPTVIIDQDSDPDATFVEITFGDRLGALLDTMNALKNLGLNVVKANVYLDSSGKHNKFAITKASSGRKVDEPELLEAIRLTIINNLLEYHPESSAQLAMGAAFGAMTPNQTVDVDIATHIRVYDDGPNQSLLYVETADRPGLLVDLVKIVTDINIAVKSGEFDTEVNTKTWINAQKTDRFFLHSSMLLNFCTSIFKTIAGTIVNVLYFGADDILRAETRFKGLLAKAKFHVSYNGEALIKPLQLVLANSLRYYLRRPTTEEASF